MTRDSPDGSGTRFQRTDYLLPSGEGACAISVGARPFDVESGETLSLEALPSELADRRPEGYRLQVDHLTAMLTEAFANRPSRL